MGRSSRFGGMHPACVLAAVLPIVAGCGGKPEKPVAGSAPIQTRKTIGKTTQNVLELSAALRDGGVLASMEITGDGLEAYSDAYRTSVGKMASIAVEQKMGLYEAEHGSRPATYEEFMEKIIGRGRPDGLQLPMLPYYQEYAFDPAKRAVVVVEFPAKKEQRQRETTGAAGL